MATLGTLNPTTNTVDSDDYLVRQGGIDYKQDRETLAAGVANARYSATADYDAGSVITGSDGYTYKANTANGPSSTAVDPVGDTTGVWFSQFRALKGVPSGGFTDESQEGYSFAGDGDTGLFATGGTNIDQSDIDIYIDNVPVAKFTSSDVSLASNGYYKMPSGLIVQWGTGTTTGGNGLVTATYSITFPTAVVGAFANTQLDNSNATAETIGLSSSTIFSITTTPAGSNINTADGETVNWIAIGY